MEADSDKLVSAEEVMEFRQLAEETIQNFDQVSTDIAQSIIEKIEGEPINEIGKLRFKAGYEKLYYFDTKHNLIIYYIKWFGKVIMAYIEPFSVQYEGKKSWVWKYSQII